MQARRFHGPTIAATPLWGASNGQMTQLLTEEERAELSIIASIVRFEKGMTIYQEGEEANAVFNIVEGVVKSYGTLPDGTERVSGFLFADDLFGLAENGRFVNSTRAVTNVTAYRLPVPALERRLRKDAALEFHVICKLCHDLRETQQHALLLGSRDAVGKTVLFLQLLSHRQTARGEPGNELSLPMSRSDIASYVGMSLEAVSRAFRTLVAQGVITCPTTRSVHIEDAEKFHALAARVNRSKPAGAAGQAVR